jgi:hypothetical protein
MPATTRIDGSRRLLGMAIAATALLAATPAARAVPSFARQTGMACEACHTVFPELTHFGRVFKANGYTLTNLKKVQDVSGRREQLLELSTTPPLSIMAQISYTQMQKSVPDLSSVNASGVSQNGTAGFPQQLSLFYAGEIAPHFGGMIQLTYADDSGTIGIDNTDLRFADEKLLPDSSTLTYGVSLNNNPTVQDLWNSTPAWGFPYTSSNANVSPLAGTAINGAFAQNVAGLTGYVFWKESLYLEAGGYRSAEQGVTNQLTGGAGPLDGTASNVIQGLAPYWRAAYEHDWDRNNLEVGVYGFNVKVLPGAASGTTPPIALNGPYNRFSDVAEDLQYQYLGEEHLFSVEATHIHENMTLNSSFATGGAANLSDNLNQTQIAATYYYRRKFGGTIQYFDINGSSDNLLYPANAPGGPGVVFSANGSPKTNGWIAELDYLPWLNVKLTAQYTFYNNFNGGNTNYDGTGRNASGNDTLYLLLWFAF